MKTLVAYVFHEYNSRVQMFYHNCIFKDDNVDFLVICNNKKIHLPEIDYVKVIKRDNIGYDFGGWSEGILTDDLYKKYDSFIFVNSSVIGPYLPSYYKGKWTDVYLQGLTDTVKLFGSTINVPQPHILNMLYKKEFTEEDRLKYIHLQSYIFSMNRETLEFLIEKELFSTTNYVTEFYDAVTEKEIKMSRLIIENGWNIGSLQDGYKNVDFTFRKQQTVELLNDDVMFPEHLNKSWTLYELVFIKGNRFDGTSH
jgi:lipopolysaccharide biosynthesis protein